MHLIDSAKQKAAGIVKKMKGNNLPFFRFFTNIFYQRWAIAIGLCLILSIILAPEIHIITPEYKAGTISSKDIKADRDFLVEDMKSTRQKKSDAGINIKSVYDYDSSITSYIKLKLNRSFNLVDEFYQNITKDKLLEPGFVNSSEVRQLRKNLDTNFGFRLNNEEFSTLLERKYSNVARQKIYRVILNLYEDKYITNADLTRADKEKGIILRDLKSQNEKEINDVESIIHIENIDTALWKKIHTFFPTNDQELRRVTFSISKKLVEPNLTFNKEATEKKRSTAEEEIKPVFFLVQKNEMIVREGEKITPLEETKLKAFFKATGDNRFSGIAAFLGLFCTALFLSVVLYFWRTRNWLKDSHNSNIDLLAFAIIVVLQIIFIKIGIFMASALNRAFPVIAVDACFFAIPFAMGSMILAVLINRNVALIFSVLASLLIGFLFDDKVIFPIYSFLGSVAASYQIVSIRQRSSYLKTGIFLAIINMAAIFCLNLTAGNLFHDLLLRLFAGFIGGILTGIFVAGLIPVFESIFGFMTYIKLLELANLNQPIFQKMIVEAPGTYHHSIIVASLVEAAGEAIGADAILAKVSAYYHDIGKLKKPQYFIENQSKNDNKHDKLSPKMSSLIIISHVKEGCELAKQAKLGRQIINIIRESHGTSIVSYFYDKAKKDKDESIRSLSETDFRYPGPKPQTKEAGLVMIGDVVEASSRTLSNPTPSRISSLVRERIERIYTDGQLDECELTLKDLNTIAETFTRILNGIFHQRIDYPDQAQKNGNGKKENNENTNRQPSEKN